MAYDERHEAIHNPLFTRVYLGHPAIALQRQGNIKFIDC